MSTASRIVQETRPSGRATLTIEEAARELGIGRGLAYELARRGEIPTLRLGRRLVVPVAAFQRLLATGGTESPGGDDRTAA